MITHERRRRKPCERSLPRPFDSGNLLGSTAADTGCGSAPSLSCPFAPFWVYCLEIRASFSTVNFATSVGTDRESSEILFVPPWSLIITFVSMLTTLPNRWRSYAIPLIEIRLLARILFIAPIMTRRRRRFRRSFILKKPQCQMGDSQFSISFISSKQRKSLSWSANICGHKIEHAPNVNYFLLINIELCNRLSIMLVRFFA